MGTLLGCTHYEQKKREQKENVESIFRGAILTGAPWWMSHSQSTNIDKNIQDLPDSLES